MKIICIFLCKMQSGYEPQSAGDWQHWPREFPAGVALATKHFSWNGGYKPATILTKKKIKTPKAVKLADKKNGVLDTFVKEVGS